MSVYDTREIGKVKIVMLGGAGSGGSSTLAGLDDTDITSPSNGQVLIYDGTSGKWENGADPLPIANGGTGNTDGYIRTGAVSGTTIGTYATVEGSGNSASGFAAHAEGSYTSASGNASHAGGVGTVAGSPAQTAIGQYNNNQFSNLFEVGNGTSASARSNAFTVSAGGNVTAAGTITAGGTITDGNGNTIPAIATTNVAGKVKPDGTTITVDSNGTITAQGGVIKKTVTQSGAIRYIDISPWEPAANDVVSIVFSNNVSLTQLSAWFVSGDSGQSVIQLLKNGNAISSSITAGTCILAVYNGTSLLIADDGIDETPIATTSVAGKVKPDGTTITVASDGTIASVDQTPIATTSTAGKVKPDGLGIDIDASGKISVDLNYIRNVKEIEITQSGTISAIELSEFPRNHYIYVLHFNNNVSTSLSVWAISASSGTAIMSYPIYTQSGGNYSDPISAGTYLSLIFDPSGAGGNGSFVLLQNSTSGGNYVSNVAWDTTNKKLTKTVGGTTSDVVTGATILNGLTSAQVTTALGYTPPTQDTDTHRPIQVNGSQVLGNNTTALNLKAGSNMSITNSSGTVTFTATDTNTHRPIQVNGSQILGDSTTALNLKAGTNVTLSSSSGTVTINASGGGGGAEMSKKRYTVSYSSWSSSTSSGYYYCTLTLSTALDTSYPPNIYIAGSGDNSLPTSTQKRMYAMLNYFNLSATTSLTLYSHTKPTSSFYIWVEGKVSS